MEFIFIAAAAAGLAIGALLLPATVRTTVEICFDAPIEAVWDVYTDFESQPAWRSDVVKVRMDSDKKGWTEELKTHGMKIHFQILEEAPPARLVLQTGAEGSFEGRYSAEFRQESGGTAGAFTEESTALGIVPKVLRRLFFNQRKFIEAYAEEARAEIKKRELAN